MNEIKRLDGIYKKPHSHDQYYWWGGVCSQCGKRARKRLVGTSPLLPVFYEQYRER